MGGSLFVLARAIIFYPPIWSVDAVEAAGIDALRGAPVRSQGQYERDAGSEGAGDWTLLEVALGRRSGPIPVLQPQPAFERGLHIADDARIKLPWSFPDQFGELHWLYAASTSA